MTSKKRAGSTSLRRELERKRTALDKRGAASTVAQFGTLSTQLSKAHDLIESRSYADAEQLLDQIDDGSTEAVLELKVFLFQTTENHESCSRAAQRLMELQPADPDALIMFAQESMYCGRVTIANQNYRKFLSRFPEHPNAVKAANALKILAPEIERRVHVADFLIGEAEELLVLHEESLQALNGGEYSLCATKCQELLARAPSFISARNNLAIAYFQSGSHNAAIDVAEETLALAPTNSFAHASLAKLLFQSGRGDDAHRIADQLMLHSPTDQDPYVASLEMLAILGRDAELLKLAESKLETVQLDAQHEALRYHYLAYALSRLGDEKAAKAAWTKCLKLFPGLTNANENLSDLTSSAGHSPWPIGFGNWLPIEKANRLVKAFRSEKSLALSEFPEVASLIPALLDRGDPVGREFAFRLAMADASPKSVEALKVFSLGSRGPDHLRTEALTFLTRRGFLEAGLQRFYSRGKWIETSIWNIEIFTEPEESDESTFVDRLLSDGTEAMYENDLQRAERFFEKAIAESPNCCTAVLNLCVVWMRRDGVSGVKRAKVRLEKLYSQFPEYGFALITLAQIAAVEQDFQKSRDLLAIAIQCKRMHISQAIALYTAQIHLYIATKDLATAEKTYQTLCDLASKDYPGVASVKAMIERAKSNRAMLQLRK